MNKLYPFQHQGVGYLLESPGKRGILAYSTGLGKSATTITALAELDSLSPTYQLKVLIICPSVVKWHWLNQLDEWWPAHPHAEVIQYGKARKLSKPKTLKRDLSYSSPIQIVSYALLGEISVGPWDAIIFDEAHNLIHPSSAQSKSALAITEANNGSAVWHLTATLAPTEPLNLYGPLSVLQPGCWGKLDKNKKRSFEFLSRYSQGERGSYGWKFDGLNPVHAPELKDRLETFTHRVTEADVAHMLPRVQYDVLPQDGPVQVSELVEWTSNALEDTTHVCIFTWHKKQTYDLADAIKDKVRIPTVAITGDLDAKKRLATVAAVKESQRGVIVATMASLGIGIDLGFCERVAFAELSGRAEHIIQACGRVAGFRSQGRTKIVFIVGQDEATQRKAWRLSARLSSIGDLYALDDAGQAAGQLFNTKALDEELMALTFDDELDNLDFGE